MAENSLFATTDVTQCHMSRADNYQQMPSLKATGTDVIYSSSHDYTEVTTSCIVYKMDDYGGA